MFRPTGKTNVHGCVVAVKSACAHVKCNGDTVELLGFGSIFPPPRVSRKERRGVEREERRSEDRRKNRDKGKKEDEENSHREMERGGGGEQG